MTLKTAYPINFYDIMVQIWYHLKLITLDASIDSLNEQMNCEQN